MPVLMQTLTPEELVAGNKSDGARAEMERLYDALIADINPGAGGVIGLADDEHKQTARNRLRAAAKRRGLEVEVYRTVGQTIKFRLIEPTQTEAEQPKRGKRKAEPAGNGVADETVV